LVTQRADLSADDGAAVPSCRVSHRGVDSAVTGGAPAVPAVVVAGRWWTGRRSGGRCGVVRLPCRSGGRRGRGACRLGRIGRE
jgi:hypothetical protein